VKKRIVEAYLDLVDDIKRILKPSIREDNPVQCVRQPIRCRASLKGIDKVGFRVWDSFDMPAQHDEPGDGNEDESEDFDDADCVGNAVGEARVEDDGFEKQG